MFVYCHSSTNLLQILELFKLYDFNLLCVKRCNWRIIIDLNSSPLLLVAIMEWQLPPTFLFRRAQPEPHQVPPWCWRRVVLVRSPSMQYVVVRQKLYVTDIEDHVQRKTQGGGLEDLGSMFLRI